MPKPNEALEAARGQLRSTTGKLAGLVSKLKDAPDSLTNLDEVDEVCLSVKEEVKKVVEARGPAKPKPEETKEEEDANALCDEATTLKGTVEGDRKAKKDGARKLLMQADAKATSAFTADVAELQDAIKEAEEAGAVEKELAGPKQKLVEFAEFAQALKLSAAELKEAAARPALKLNRETLEHTITEHEAGAVAMLNKTVVELYMNILTKPPPTSICTPAFDETLAKAEALGVDPEVIKANKKKNEEAKKAQNAKKIADRKAKKPPSDEPTAPDEPEAHPSIAGLKVDLETALAKAKAKLLEANTSTALLEKSEASLLTAEKLLDLEEQASRDEPHATIAALEEALKAATEAKADAKLLEQGKKALDDAIATRFGARTKLALTNMLDAASVEAAKMDVGKLGTLIGVAEKEEVDAAEVEKCKAKLAESYKEQSEGGLEPLAAPQELSHEGFSIIDPLKAAIEEARKRGAAEDLLIKGQAKLDFWIEARNRRDKAKKELDAELKPPPAAVDQKLVKACLAEAMEAKLDPELLSKAAGQLKVATLAQRVFEKAKGAPGTLVIAVLAAELNEVGGAILSHEQACQAALEKECETLREKMDLIKETKESQKARDAILAKQVKKGATKQKAAKAEDVLLPAWARAPESELAAASPSKEKVETVGQQQERELQQLQIELKAQEEELKKQEAHVKEVAGTVVVPADVIAFAQLKLKAAKTCDEMQRAQEPQLLDLDKQRLQAAIKACEFKFGELPIAGIDDQDCNVPAAELRKARDRLRDAERAQKRQQQARTQLTVRVNAPTGTATFDTLVKLVAEAKAAHVEPDLIARAEVKLKKMEELAASTLRAGPLAFVSFHLPCLRSCVSRYAISLVEQAEAKRRQDTERKEAAAAALQKHIGTWETGQINKTLMEVNVGELQEAIAHAAVESVSQELIELGRLKLIAIDKYKLDKERGLIKDDEPAKKKAADDDGAKNKKPKFKNYGYVKKDEE